MTACSFACSPKSCPNEKPLGRLLLSSLIRSIKARGSAEPPLAAAVADGLAVAFEARAGASAAALLVAGVAVATVVAPGTGVGEEVGATLVTEDGDAATETLRAPGVGEAASGRKPGVADSDVAACGESAAPGVAGWVAALVAVVFLLLLEEQPSVQTAAQSRTETNSKRRIGTSTDGARGAVVALFSMHHTGRVSRQGSVMVEIADPRARSPGRSARLCERSRHRYAESAVSLPRTQGGSRCRTFPILPLSNPMAASSVRWMSTRACCAIASSTSVRPSTIPSPT